MQNPQWIIEGARSAPNSLENLRIEKGVSRVRL